LIASLRGRPLEILEGMGLIIQKQNVQTKMTGKITAANNTEQTATFGLNVLFMKL
jgi:hypothetical protein